jgi:hypothetical protein
MDVMRRICLFVLVTAAAFAQADAPPAEKPPADVDQAVRARVTEFYTLMKNHEYRKGESLIAEDTKEYYYAGGKPEIHTFEILEVEYSGNFTRAKAITRCSQPLVMAGFPPGEITVKMPTLWKLENGNWFLYEDPTKIASPGGLQKKVQAAVEAGAAVASADKLPAGMPKEIPQDPSFAFGKIEVDKAQVSLTAGATEQIHIDNRSSGPMRLELGYPLKGVDAKLDRRDLNKGEGAVLTLKAGEAPSGGPFYLRVLPTEEAITIRVSVEPPKAPAVPAGKVDVDKTEVSLKAGATEQIHIDNHSSAPMTLELGRPLKGVEAKLDRRDLNKGERAVLTLKAGKAASGGMISLRVLPTGEAITIRVAVRK